MRAFALVPGMDERTARRLYARGFRDFADVIKLGLPEAAVFFRVTLPLAARGIAAGVLLAFARALGEFGATLMIAGNLPGRTQTLSVAIYEAAY